MPKDGRSQIQMIAKNFDGVGDGFLPGSRCEKWSVGRTLQFCIVLTQVQCGAQLAAECVHRKYRVFGDGGDE
jgi:hypothetical protein